MAIELKNLDQLKSMRKAGLVVADTLQLLKAECSGRYDYS